MFFTACFLLETCSAGGWLFSREKRAERLANYPLTNDTFLNNYDKFSAMNLQREQNDDPNVLGAKVMRITNDAEFEDLCAKAVTELESLGDGEKKIINALQNASSGIESLTNTTQDTFLRREFVVQILYYLGCIEN
jgi:hypothetical protein